MFQSLIGKKSDKVKNVIERGLVKRFAEAIGDSDYIYYNEEAGRLSWYRNNIAPPTYPRVLDYGTIEGLLLPKKGLIHGEQIYNYRRPIIVGEVLYCYTELLDYYEKNGSGGTMGFFTIARYGEDGKGETIFTEKSIIILTEAVRREFINEHN